MHALTWVFRSQRTHRRHKTQSIAIKGDTLGQGFRRHWLQAPEWGVVPPSSLALVNSQSCSSVSPCLNVNWIVRKRLEQGTNLLPYPPSSPSHPEG